MAAPADRTAPPLSDELRELALSLPISEFKKNMLCPFCGNPAIDSFRLPCCNERICASCHGSMTYPAHCKLCDHSPLDPDLCLPFKKVRTTLQTWLQKLKKKQEAITAAQIAAPLANTSEAAPEVQPATEAAQTPVDGPEGTANPAEAATEFDNNNAPMDAGETTDGAPSVSAALNEENQNTATSAMTRQESTASQNKSNTMDPSSAEDGSGEQANFSGAMMGSNDNSMMGGMQGQMPFFANQAGLRGMNWGGMNPMMGMSNMMTNGNFNPMEFGMNNMNSMNNMYGTFGGNMGMGMNDMSAMNMMNFNGGYGGGYGGMGSGYGSYSGPNQMGSYSQSGLYPEMMNQFPKNNYLNQGQNRFHANQGGGYLQRDRKGSRGSFVTNPQGGSSRPHSRSDQAQTVRPFRHSSFRTSPSVADYAQTQTDMSVSKQQEDQSPDGNAGPAPEAEAEGEQSRACADVAEDGKNNVNANEASGDASGETVTEMSNRPIETLETGDGDDGEDDNNNEYHHSALGSNVPQNTFFSSFDQDMAMDMGTNMNMNMNMGFGQQQQQQHHRHHYHNFHPRGGYNNSGAYGDARVLTGSPAEPMGVGVAGAPTKPRAMREGRPNTGFSSRMHSGRFIPPPAKSAAESNLVVAVSNSPQQTGRSTSPRRDQSSLTKQESSSRSKSPSRSRSLARDDGRDDFRERSQRDDQEQAKTPYHETDHDVQKDRRRPRSSRKDDRDDDYDDRHRDDRISRGDRTRSVSADSRYRSSRRDKERHRSSRSYRERSKERDSRASSRYKERERDRKERKDKDHDYDYDRDKERAREKDKDRRRRRDWEAAQEEDERDYDDDKYRSSRRSRKDRDRERDRGYDDDDGDNQHHSHEDYRERPALHERGEEQKRQEEDDDDDDEDVIGGMIMKKRPVSPPFNPPTGPSANGFSIKGRSKNPTMLPPQPPAGARASFQPPKGPAADRNKDDSTSRRRPRNSSISSRPDIPTTHPAQDHYAAERERNARERDSRERANSSSVLSREHSSRTIHPPTASNSSSRSSRKRTQHDFEEPHSKIPRGPKGEGRNQLSSSPADGPDKQRKNADKYADQAKPDIQSFIHNRMRGVNGNPLRGGVRMEGEAEKQTESRNRRRK